MTSGWGTWRIISAAAEICRLQMPINYEGKCSDILSLTGFCADGLDVTENIYLRGRD